MALSGSLKRLLDDDDTAVALVSLDRAPHDASDAMLRLLGATSVDELRTTSGPAAVLRSFLDQLPTEMFTGGQMLWRGRIDHRDARGARVVLRATATSRLGEPGELAVLLHDVSKPAARMATLADRASRDALTGLPNRERLLSTVVDALAHQREHGGVTAAIVIDVDRLKYVNDAFGHTAGDDVLIATAERLAAVVRPTDHVARIGGDEFAVIAENIGDATTALDFAERTRRALSGQLSVGELDLDFSVSVGVALSDADVLARPDGDAGAVLVGNADVAMYESKRAGRNRCTLFTPPMRSQARGRTEIAAALAHTISAGDLDVAYQPIFSTVTQSVVGAEALVRSHQPVDTAVLIDIAEESGTILQLGEVVLDRSLSDLLEWMRLGVVDAAFSVHVNVSRLQLASPTFVRMVAAALKRYGLASSQLVLEARESPHLSDAPEVVRSIHALRRLGVRVAVDNFGTGPKALAVLTDVGADVLKLDGSLALPTGSSDADERLVRAVVLLAHALEMQVVAERVSGPQQLQRLQAAGCDMAQGNLLAFPTSADDLPLAAAASW